MPLFAFAGRTPELAALREAVTAPPALILMSGEAGIGKSRLAQEAVAGAPGLVLVAHCDDMREPLPLGPVRDALRPHAPDPFPDDPVALVDAVTARLGALGPAVLVVEDVQMADPVTLDFLDRLAARPVPTLTVLITQRDDEAPPAWIPPSTVRRLTLPPLSHDDVAALAGAEPDDPYVTRLFARTAGIPFLIEEVLRSGIALDDEVPALLRDVLLYRMRPLDEPAREILGAAAVVGMTADERRLAAVLRLDPAVIRQALDAAQTAGLLHEEDGRRHFRHTLARQVVYELLPATTRRWLHLQAARTLEEQSPKPVAQLAHHYRLAGSAADHVRNASAAADLAVEQGDDATAARFLLGTMAEADLPRPLRVRLAVKLGRAAVEGAMQAEAIPVLRRILADRRLPPGARGEIGLVLGRALRQQGEALAGYVELEKAVPYLRHRDRKAGALAILSAPDTVVGRHADDHLRYWEQAAALSGSLLAVRIAGVSLRLELGLPGVWSDVDALLADDSLTSSPREYARACLNWAQGALHVGHLDHATTLLARARQATEQERLLPVAELTAFAIDLAHDRVDGLTERLRGFVARPARMPLTNLDARVMLGRLLARSGEVAEATEILTAVTADAARAGAVSPLIQARTALAGCLLTVSAARAEAEAATTIDLVRAKGIWAWAGEAVTVRWRALTALDRAADAQACAAELREGTAGRDAPAAEAALAALSDPAGDVRPRK
ncbi:AAA family ATPase [Actinoplanes sp. NBRC 101535]|uniref:ATP-binding protein n=1 Tax=Actinoplanes sp. NBRC 101535 TaxID=3032196 RepID=UPI0024A1F2B7|nr:AAA family ATPase [Actinoplanes sp. NBRC 101535]GLY07054.1 LuxR family transcriptional regulator [Actinoplanes sp. NBRC 101535]